MKNFPRARRLSWIWPFVFFCEIGLRAVVFTVSNTNDTGPGSFRQAILLATNAPRDTIQFQITNSPPFVISPTNALPPLSRPVIIDATTQPGFINRPVVELNGAAAGGTAGLTLSGGNSIVRGLSINRFAYDGIRIELNGTNVIEGNFIGVGLSGNSDSGNGEGGVTIINSQGNIIGGTISAARNVISGGNLIGIFIQNSSSTGNQVIGNFIGTDVTGTIDRGNKEDGIWIYQAPQNTIGGFTASARNIISGNGESGILLYGLGATQNIIAGNFIGTDVQGALALGNSTNGIKINLGSFNQIGSSSSGGRNLISGNRERGVYITGANAQGNVLLGNFIGTDISGSAILGNTFEGVGIYSCSSNIIGGLQPGARNLISGNYNDGVVIDGAIAKGNLVQGNYIGTDLTGTFSLGNRENGVQITLAPSNTIGGIMTGAQNLISGNGQCGIFITNTLARGNQVQGNFIGTDATGTLAVGNVLNGVALVDAPSNLIGGSFSGAGNLISGNSYKGISLQGISTSQNRVEGNFIGTDYSGTVAVPNKVGGIFFYGSPSNIIGGTLAGAGNLISGNSFVAMSLGDPGCVGNIVQGNSIGTAVDKLSPVGNELHGIEILNTSSNNLIGGVTSGAGNTIAFARTSLYAGVRVRDGCSRNSIRGNSIFSNNGLGIDLGVNGPSLNDLGDADSGANDLQNFPIITSAFGRYITTVQGTLNSGTNKTYALDFYSSQAPDPSNYGEGQRWLGTIGVTTAGNGNGSFAVNFTNSVPLDRYITATATDSANNTSEFSLVATIPTNSPAIDTDGDGMPDDYEIAAHLNPNNPGDAALDGDGDGSSNLNEYLAATDPLDATSVLRLSLVKSASGAQLRFQTAPERNYAIEFSTDLVNWQPLPNATNIVGDGAIVQINDSGAVNAPKRFYRIHLLLPPGATSVLRLFLVKSESGAQLRFQTVAGKHYAIEFSDNLVNWQPLPNATNIVGDGTIVQVNDPGAVTAPLRFYRVHVLP